MSQNVDFKKFLNVYEFECKLSEGQEVKFKPVTTGQLKKLLGYGNESNPIIVEKALDDLITSSVTSKDFKISELYLQDRFTLLVEIRKATKGSKYEFEYKCPSCKSQLYKVIDLNELPVTAPPSQVNPVVELFEGFSVELDNIRRKDQINATKILPKGLNDVQLAAELSLLTYASGIKAVNTPDGREENLSITDKKYILENISMDAYEKVRNWYDTNDFGINFSFKIDCHNCDYNKEINIPLDSFFL